MSVKMGNIYSTLSSIKIKQGQALYDYEYSTSE